MTRSTFRCELRWLLVAALGSAALWTPLLAQADVTVPASATALQGQLNINTATAAQWDLLPGIGPATAAKLVAYRERRRFESLTHVMRVKGIGRKTYREIRPYLTLQGDTTLTPSRS